MRGISLSRVLPTLALTVPSVSIVLLDVVLRRATMQRFDAADWLSYGLTTVLSLALWGGLLWAARVSFGPARVCCGVAFVLFFGIALGGQAYFFEQYGSYLTVEVARFASNFRESVVHQLRADAANYLSFKGPALVFALALWLAAGWLNKREHNGRAAFWWAPSAAMLVAIALFLPVNSKRRQPSTPDVLYMNALGAIFSAQLGFGEDAHKLHPRLRNPSVVPSLRSSRVARTDRNVVLVVLESVRQDVTCNRYDPHCELTPYTNRLFPERIAFSQMRSLDSCTAISMAVLYSGLGPHEDRDTLHRVPFVFDYARAAGYDTGYFTSQNILFGNMRLWLTKLGVRHFFSALDVNPESDIDMGAPEKDFAAFARRALVKLEEPFFLTIQLSNGHYPYFVDPLGPRPFQPSTTSKDVEENEYFFNHYRNAVHQQDEHLAGLLQDIASRSSGARTVIITTSDHGEAFREHQQMGHTLSVFDEELRVPAWIHAPSGTLDAGERKALLENSRLPTYHPDLTATILDLLGVWDDSRLARFRARMLGRSLLQSKPLAGRVMPLSNCAPVWTCAFENWGVMRGSMKLHAREWDNDYRCFDLANDPKETTDLGSAACGDLRSHAQRHFRRLPGRTDGSF